MAKTAPVVSEMDGIATPSRKQAVQVAQGLAAWVEWILRDEAGNPLDLTTLGFSESSESSEGSSGTIKLRVLECLSISTSNRPVEITGEVVNAVTGVVKAKLTSAAVALPGVYILEWAGYNPDGELEHLTQGSMIVNRSLAGGAATNGPPTIAEIRLHMQDSGPEDNYLIDTTEFDLAEIAACLERVVQIWNETLEFVPRRYNTTNFPYRSQWLDAAVGFMLMLSSYNQDRNNQKYTAAGTAMNDKGNGGLYAQKGMALVTGYREWVKVRKGQINLESCYGSTEGRW